MLPGVHVQVQPQHKCELNHNPVYEYFYSSVAQVPLTPPAFLSLLQESRWQPFKINLIWISVYQCVCLTWRAKWKLPYWRTAFRTGSTHHATDQGRLVWWHSRNCQPLRLSEECLLVTFNTSVLFWFGWGASFSFADQFCRCTWRAVVIIAVPSVSQFCSKILNRSHIRMSQYCLKLLNRSHIG